MRKVLLETNNIYHIFNRGVNKGNIFFDEKDYLRFLKAAVHYKTKATKFSYRNYSLNSNNTNDDTGSLKTVEILAYCLMPNHFHFVAKQLADNGITDYCRRLFNSFSHYINIKHGRVGPLF